MLAAGGHADYPRCTRSARSDIAVVAEFTQPEEWVGTGPLRDVLRSTDQVTVSNGQITLLLFGCDEVDAAAVLHRVGITGAHLRLAEGVDLLAGPNALPTLLAGPAGRSRDRL
jgi:hypothetical protein